MDTPVQTIPTIETQIPETPKDNHWITIASMALFVLLSLGVIVFLYYQNQQLKSIIASYQTPIASPTPTASPDPTADWKTYSSVEWKYNIRYPSDWKIITAEKPTIHLLPPDSSTPSDGSVTISLSYQEKPASPYWFKNPLPLDPSVYDRSSWAIKNNDSDEITFWKNQTSVLCQPTFNTTVNKDIYAQILSTFKFTDATASPSAKPMACTQEARLCSDGSSVRRTGPNCEFAPCP